LDKAVLLERVMLLIPLILSLTVHEFFHAWTAWKLGDDTAARMGRLTLNPVPHIDPIGTLLLPLMGAPIGWAKPVPVNPAGFRRGVKMSSGDMLVSAAGPASNVALGLVAAVVFGVLLRVAPDVVGPTQAARAMLLNFMFVNAGLAIFNLLPIPPLDGSHVAGHLVPYRHRETWARFAAIGPMVLLGLIALQSLAGIPILSRVIGPPRDLVISLYSFVVNGLA
jgi:Zn-dependent protease